MTPPYRGRVDIATGKAPPPDGLAIGTIELPPAVDLSPGVHFAPALEPDTEPEEAPVYAAEPPPPVAIPPPPPPPPPLPCTCATHTVKSTTAGIVEGNNRGADEREGKETRDVRAET